MLDAPPDADALCPLLAAAPFAPEREARIDERACRLVGAIRAQGDALGGVELTATLKQGERAGAGLAQREAESESQGQRRGCGCRAVLAQVRCTSHQSCPFRHPAIKLSAWPLYQEFPDRVALS